MARNPLPFIPFVIIKDMMKMVEIPIDGVADRKDPIKGLTTEEAKARLEDYGRNEIPEKVKAA